MSITGSSSAEACTTSRSKVALHELGPRDPGGVVGASRCDCGALGVVCRQGSGGTLTPSLSRRAREQGDVADCHLRHERPQRMIRREDAVIAMPMSTRRRHEGRKATQKLVRREVETENLVSLNAREAVSA
jgi:hypothetical protein